MTDNLDALLRQVAGGDVDAFGAFYDHTRSRVFGMISRVLRDPGYSEETTQEVYLHVWRSAHTYDAQLGSPLSWLLTLAHRRAVDRVRAEQSAGVRSVRWGLAHLEPARDEVSEAVLVREEHRQVADCLGTLSAVQRECIELAYYQGMTYVQVSDRLSASLGTIKSRMRDGLRALRKCLGMI